MDQRDEGKVITLTWRFSAISILAHCGGNRPTLKHSVGMNLKAKENVWLSFFHTIGKLDQALYSHCTVLRNDIKTSYADHALSIQSYPAQTAHFVVPNHKRTKRVGEQRPLVGYNNTSFKETLADTRRRLVFLYMLLLLSFGFYKLEWKTACVKTRY